MFDWKRSVSIHISIAVLMSRSGRRHQAIRLVKLRQESINRRIFGHVASFGCPWASGRSARISAMEIIGRKRINTYSKLKNKPMEPNKVAQSQNVGEYIPQ